MPTSILANQAVNRRLAELSFPSSYKGHQPLISPLSPNAIGSSLICFGLSFTAATYPAASRIHAYPFELNEPYLCRKVWWANGTTASTDSCDVGVYTEDGSTLVVSGGPTGIAGANIIQEKDCTDTLIPPGRYWCAYIQNGITATPQMSIDISIVNRLSGCAMMAGSGATLGSTFTPVPVVGGGAFVVLCGIANRTHVA